MDKTNNPLSSIPGQKVHLKKFLRIFLPLTLLITVSSIAFYQKELSAHRQRVVAREMHSLENRRETMKNLLKSVVSDLRLLASLQEMRALPDGAPGNAAASLAAELLTFCTYRGIYERIFFIDRQGMEIIRINYNNGNPAVVPREELQFQGNRSFYRDTIRLKADEFSMSRFDLAMEQGRIVSPPTPVICLGMPVFARDGREKGTIMVNYAGNQLLQALNTTGEDDRQSIFLLNNGGYWLLGPSPQVEWGFLYPDKKEQTFQARFPAAWEEISAGEQGYVADKAGLFIFITLYPQLSILNPPRAYVNCNGPAGCSAGDKEKYYWKIVSFIPAEISDSSSSFILWRRLLFFLDGLLFLFSGAVAWLLSCAHKIPDNISV